MSKPTSVLRRKIWRIRYGNKTIAPCCWCRKPLKFMDSTLEHIIPKSLGGRNREENLDIACAECNQARGNRMSDEDMVAVGEVCRVPRKKKPPQVQQHYRTGPNPYPRFGLL